MIEIELTTAVVLYSGVLALIVAAIWLYTEVSVRRPQQLLGRQFLWRCTICGLSYLDEAATQLSKCPRCGSFNTPREARRSQDGDVAGDPVPHEPQERPRRSGSKGKRSGQRHRGGRRRR